MDNVGATETGFPGGGIQDWYNLKAEWALATYDTPSYFAANGIYELPFGKHRRWANSNGIANYLLGGWQLNGIASALSGTPLQVFMSANTLYNYSGTQRANWNGKNPVPGMPVKDRLNAYFDVNDFSAPGTFTYGNSPRTLGSLPAPGLIDLDLPAPGICSGLRAGSRQIQIMSSSFCMQRLLRCTVHGRSTSQ